MSDFRTVWRMPSGTISTVNPVRKGSEAKAGHDLEQAGATKIGEASREKPGLLNTPDFKVGDRSCRNAWRVDSLTGKLFVDFQAAKRIAAERFVAEGIELRAFIQNKLRPVARILADSNTLDLLMQAEVQIGAVEAAMPEDFSKMTGAADVAAYKPAWPTLEN